MVMNAFFICEEVITSLKEYSAQHNSDSADGASPSSKIVQQGEIWRNLNMISELYYFTNKLLPIRCLALQIIETEQNGGKQERTPLDSRHWWW